jgi:hypothetical protein
MQAAETLEYQGFMGDAWDPSHGRRKEDDG